MKSSNKALLAAILFLAACTKGQQKHFQFGLLENRLVGEVSLEEMGVNTVHARSAESGITLKAKEYTGGEAAFGNLKAKVKFSVRNAFGTFNSSYPGTISKAVACDPSLLPEAVENPANGASGYITKANDRQNFGVCDRKEVKFDMIYLVVKCADDRLYEVKAFRPVSSRPGSSLRDIFLAFRCR
jgi:hypothetical protein